MDGNSAIDDAASEKSGDGVLVDVLIALGSNIRPEFNLPEAVRRISENPQIELQAVSSVWESSPIGFTDQPNFLNAAIRITTTLSPHTLKFRCLRDIEGQLLRVRDPHNKNGPRTIDLDIAMYGQQLITEPDLVIPDPEIVERAFLIIPLAEIASEFLHPVEKRPIGQLAANFSEANTLTPRSDISL